MDDLRKKLSISEENIDVIQKFFLDESNPFVNDLPKIVEKYGGVDEINKKFKEARKIETIYKKLETVNPDYIDDLEWLIKNREKDSFISESEYRRKVLGNSVDRITFDESSPACPATKGWTTSTPLRHWDYTYQWDDGGLSDKRRVAGTRESL